MSAGSSSLGRRVLELSTDASGLRKGLSEARALTIQQTAKLKADAKVQLQADLLRLKSDFQQAQREAVTSKRLIEQQSRYDLSINLAKYKSDLRSAEREQSASLKRMQEEARQSQQSAGGLLSGLGGAVLQGVGIGTGFGLVTQGVGAVTGAIRSGTAAILEYNASLESSEARIRGFTGSQQAVAEAQRIANAEAERGRGAYAETLSALADLTPLARTYNANLIDLLHTTQLLAATDPAQGFEGAATAIREALSGDFTSLVRRFEIPRTEIERLKTEGVPNLQIVQQALGKLGINDSLLTQQVDTFTQQLKIAKDTALRTLAAIGEPLSDLGKDALKALAATLNSPEVKAALQDFGDDLRGGVNDLRAFLADPATKQGLHDLATSLRDVADSARDMGADLKDVAGPGFLALLDVVNRANDGFRLFNDTIDAIDGKLPGLGALLRTITPFAGGPDLVGQFRQIVADARELYGLVSGNRQPFVPPARTPLTGPESTGTPDPGRAAPVAAPLPPTSAPGYRSPAVAPDTERQFQASADASIARRYADLFAAGKADLQAYIQGFESSDFDIYSKLGPEIKASFDRAFGGLSISEQIDKGLAGLDVLTARIVDDLKRTGTVSTETAAAIGRTLGDEAGNAVLGLADRYGKLATATTNAAAAADDLKEKQRQLGEAQATAARHADESREIIDALTRSQKALADAADEAARGYAARLDELGRAQSSLSAQAEEVARGYQAQIDALQREREEVDRLTQAHRDEAQAQIDGLAAVQNAKSQDATVKALEVKQRADLLALEERIRAARSRGDEKGARALEDQRALVQARGNYALDIARQRAAVAGDKADAARKPIEDAAAAQEKKDKAAADAIDARIKATQAEAKTAADDYAARGRAIQSQIDDLQTEAKNVAADYAARGRAIQANIDKETERARIVAAADRLAVSAAQSRLTNAQNAKEAADGELTSARNMVTVIGEQNTALGNRIKDQKDFIAFLQGLGIDVAKYFNGTGGTGIPNAAPPRPQQTGPDPYYDPGQRTPGDSLIEYRPSAYAPPVPPSNAASYLRAAGVGAAATASRQVRQEFHAPLVAFPNATIRETVDIERAARLGADLAQRELLEALDNDQRAGGGVTTYQGG